MTTNFTKCLIKSCVKSFTTQKQPIRNLGLYKAAVMTDISRPWVIDEKQQKKVGKNDVRIKVHYCSLNSADATNFRCPGKELPFTAGYELSGKVLEIGKNVTKEQITVGEQVGALSLEKFGGFAEECVVDASDCFRLPPNVTMKDAAVLMCSHTTAIYAFSKLRTPKENETVVISAGPAGSGLAAIDVAAHMFKAKVIAVCDSEDRNDFMRSRGAFSTVVFDEKIKEKVLSMNDKKGASIVYDGVGDYMLERISHCAARHGTIFHAAPYLCKAVPIPPANTFLAMVSLTGLRQQDLALYRTMVNDTLELAHDGIISAHVSANFKLGELNQAIDFIEEKKSTGKIVIQIGDT